MKKMYKLTLMALVAFAALFASSCKDEEYDLDDMKSDGLNIHTSLAAPLVKSHSTFADIFDMESIKGYLRPVGGDPINLAETGLGEIQQLLSKPMDIKNTTKFNSSVIIDDINFDDIFGDENALPDIDKLMFIFDVETNVPFDISLKIDFVTGPNPTNFSPRIPSLHNEVMVPASKSDKDIVKTEQIIEYGDVAKELSTATGMLIELNFTVPDDLKYPQINLQQYVDIKLKAYVEGDLNPSNF